MEPVGNVEDLPWEDGSVLRGAREFQIMELVANDPTYTKAFSLEYVRISKSGHSVTHVNSCSHFLYVLDGVGEITIEDRTWPLRAGSYARVKGGKRHSLRNQGGCDMYVLAIYDPPRITDKTTKVD